MFRGRHLLLPLSATCVALIVACAPLTFISNDGGWRVSSALALAAAGGNSGNSGGGNSGSSGGAGAGNSGGSGGAGAGDSGGSGGAGAGNSGGSGNSGGNAGGGGAGNSGGGNNADGGVGNGQTGKGGGGATGTAGGQGSSISVQHSNGMKESILNGRYEMQDASGRTIINRPASRADRSRLERQRRNDPR